MMAKRTIAVKFLDLDLEVSGIYIAPVMETREYPGDPADFEIDKVYHNDNDITEILENLELFYENHYYQNFRKCQEEASKAWKNMGLLHEEDFNICKEEIISIWEHLRLLVMDKLEIEEEN